VHPIYAFSDDRPTLCPADGGKTWYFAFGTDVFELTNLTSDYLEQSIVGNEVALDLLVPPDKNAPSGCFGNPQQIREFFMVNWPMLQPKDYKGDLPSLVYVFHLYGRRGIETPDFIGPMNKEALVLPDHPCYRMDFFEGLNDGSFYCSIPKDNLQNLKLGSMTGWEIVVSKDTYTLPLGQQLSVFGDFLFGFDVMYQIDPYLYIWYKWTPPQKAHNFNIKYFVDVNVSVLNALKSIQVQNYPWPRQTIKLWPYQTLHPEMQQK